MKEAIKIIKSMVYCYEATDDVCEEAGCCMYCEGHTETQQEIDALKKAIESLEEAIKHEETFEWCADCKEYDQENHCCHRWSKNIKRTIESSKKVWYNEGFEDGKIHACSEGALREVYKQGKEEGYEKGYMDAENSIYNDTWDRFPD